MSTPVWSDQKHLRPAGITHIIGTFSNSASNSTILLSCNPYSQGGITFFMRVSLSSTTLFWQHSIFQLVLN